MTVLDDEEEKDVYPISSVVRLRPINHSTRIFTVIGRNTKTQQQQQQRVLVI